jgi:hypothetical protein
LHRLANAEVAGRIVDVAPTSTLNFDLAGAEADSPDPIVPRRTGRKTWCLVITKSKTEGDAAMNTEAFPAGGYRFIPGVFQYSGGVAALPGFEIVRVRFRQAPILADGFQRIATHLKDAGRPAAAFCACELRSPAPFSEAGFRAFNQVYVARLRALGVLGDELNPVARTNVCPEVAPPAEPGIHAFCYTRPASGGVPTFVVSGSGEVPEGRANYRDHIVRQGDTSPEGLREKARFVVAAMEQRLAALDASWAETTATQVYTVHDIHLFLAEELVQRGAAQSGITWHFARPPVAGLDYEMDCRGTASEIVV